MNLISPMIQTYTWKNAMQFLHRSYELWNETLHKQAEEWTNHAHRTWARQIIILELKFFLYININYLLLIFINRKKFLFFYLFFLFLTVKLLYHSYHSYSHIKVDVCLFLMNYYLLKPMIRICVALSILIKEEENNGPTNVVVTE